MRIAKCFLYIFLVIFLCKSGCYGTENFSLKTREAITQPMLRDLQRIIDTEFEIKFRGKPRKLPVRPASSDWLSANNGVHILVLKNGRKLGSGEASYSTLAGNVRIAAACAFDGCKVEDSSGLVVMLEVFLADRKEEIVNPFSLAEIIDPGRQGGRLVFSGKDIRVTASEVILSDSGTKKVFTKKLNSRIEEVNKQLLFNEENRYYIFNSVIALIFPGEEIGRIYRFNKLFNLSNLTYSSVREALELARKWYVANQHDDGGFPAAYRPMEDKVTDKKGWLGNHIYNCSSVASLAKVTDDKDLLSASQKNLANIITKYYLDNPEQRLGYVKDGRDISLGNSAALLDAILTNDEINKYQEHVVRLIHFLNYMRLPEGNYRCFMNKPVNVTNDFFPGQAQASLMKFFSVTRNEQVLTGVAASFKYYRSLFDKKLSLLMSPWHSEAYLRLYDFTKQRPAVDFVFKMNDLLISIQDKKDSTGEDMKGRFVRIGQSNRDHLGETSLYLSGILDAFSLAKQVGDSERISRYRMACVMAVRYLLQMQVRDRYDTWCMPCPEKATGGFRDREDSSVIRIENQAYSVEALCKVLQVLSEKDFQAVRVEAGL